MSHFKTTLCMIAMGSLSACSASSQQHAHIDSAKTKGEAHITTVKPGASVSINTVLPKSMTSGSFQTVQLEFDEAYSDGTLSVTIEPSAGLSLFGGTASKTFDMTVSEAHVWDLDVKADVDGVYFLNVFAEAHGQPRSFSVRLDIGQISQKMRDDAMPSNGKLSDGGKIRILDAKETIK